MCREHSSDGNEKGDDFISLLFAGDKELQGKDIIRFYDNRCNNVLNLRFYGASFELGKTQKLLFRGNLRLLDQLNSDSNKI